MSTHCPIMANDLKEFRQAHGLTASDLVAAIRKVFPKYDKTLQSKCENGEEYGIALLPRGMDAALSLVPGAAEARRRAKRDRHKFTCRLYCRLDTETWGRLQQQAKADGYTTMQDLVTDLVKRYLHEQEDG